jgi:ADP-ribosylglycohydrolase
LAVFLVAKGDPRMTIIGAVNVGRDADTIACTAGEIAGAFAGYHAIPAEWADTVQQVNPEPEMRAIAQQLAKVVESNLETKRKLVEDLQRLL